ncbi:MAG: hypothetical protein U0229_09645 [Anaeromyxobacter sp.]
MKNLHAHARVTMAGLLLALSALLAPALAAAEGPPNRTGWVANFTPVLILAHGDDRFGGGADPEVRYCLDLGGVRVSAGARVGVYYAKNVLGVTAMPTLRLTVPVGRVEPYLAAGMGYGWETESGYSNLATMSRGGFVYRFSKGFSAGLEATYQKIEGSEHRFWSFGSAMAFGF